MYFPEHNLAVQIEELDHTDRDKNYGNEREKKNRRTWLWNFKH